MPMIVYRGNLNDKEEVIIAPGPTDADQPHEIIRAKVVNKDSAAVTLVVFTRVGSDTYEEFRGSLAVNEAWAYEAPDRGGMMLERPQVSLRAALTATATSAQPTFMVQVRE